jgi:hypothetical protein
VRFKGFASHAIGKDLGGWLVLDVGNLGPHKRNGPTHLQPCRPCRTAETMTQMRGSPWCLYKLNKKTCAVSIASHLVIIGTRCAIFVCLVTICSKWHACFIVV